MSDNKIVVAISDAPPAKEQRTKVDCAACNHWSDPIHDCPNAWMYAPPTPAPQPSKLPTPHYAVGDRFAHADGRFFEIVGVAGRAHEFYVRYSWLDIKQTWNPSTGTFYAGFAHVSGPTYYASALVMPCNCTEQVVHIGEHRSWCRTRGGES